MQCLLHRHVVWDRVGGSELGQQKLVIEGGYPLSGCLSAQGAKNAALPVMAAALLLDGGQMRLKDVPDLDDVNTMADLLRHLGCTVNFHGHEMDIRKPAGLDVFETPKELVRKMRASSLVLGPLLARCGHARLPLPGGCSIGSRPMDLHLKGLVRMGASISLEHGYVHARTEGLRGNRMYLDFPSVGATENLLMAAACARGESVIENAAREPEIMNLAEALKAMGVPVEGEGTGTIHVQGIESPKGAEVRIIPDRIEASTFLIAGVLTGGDVTVNQVVPDHLEALLAKLEEAGAGVEVGADCVRVFRKGKLNGLTLKTLPYPGFPTDMQPQMMVLMCLSEGASVIQETVFEARLLHVGELKRMGANIEVQGNTCVVAGVPGFTGAEVRATDLRAGAALVLAGLAARGKTEITEIHHLWRGYEGLIDKIGSLGGKISLEEEEL